MKKRPNYINEIVEDANKRLERLSIKDEKDTLFGFVCDLLLSKGMYKGFNYFKRAVINVEGTDIHYLTFPTREEFARGEWDCLQIM